MKFSSENKVALLALIAPYTPLRISPTRTLSAELGTPEEFGVETFLEKVNESRECKDLYLLLQSYGGDPNSAYTIAKALRKNFENIVCFTPQIAMSGATMVAASANEIVMGELSKLSPIDPQLVTAEGKRESTLALVRGFNKLDKRFAKTNRGDIPYPYQHLIESVDLTEYESRSGVLDTVKNYSLELLKKANYTKNKAEKISRSLTFNFPSHFSIIDYEKAKELGLNVTWYNDKLTEWRLIRKWLSQYILKERAIHHMLYAYPDLQEG